MSSRRSPLLLLSLLTLSLVPAGASARKAYPIKPADPPPAAHCAPLRAQVLDLAAQNAINSIYFYPIHYRMGLEAAADGAKAAPITSGSAGPSHHTGTNNQEQGVEEGDTVKTNGRIIYSIRGNEIVIVSAWPTSSMKVLGRYQLPTNVTPSQLQLRGNRLVILSQIWEQAKVTPIASDAPSRTAIRRPHYQPPTFAGTRITVLNVGSSRRPRLVSETDVEGHLSQSRLIGNQLSFVTNGSLRVPEHVAAAALARAKKLPTLADNTDWEAREKARKKGLAIVRGYLRKKFSQLNIDDAMPRMRSHYANRPMSAFKSLYGCSQLTVATAKPGAAGSGTRVSSSHFVGRTGLVTVSSLNIYRPTVVKSAGVTGSGWQIYASARAMYVAMPNYNSSTSNTRILKFALRGRRGPRFVASGFVPGHLLNQFAMSEHDGTLRVMTTDAQWGPNGRNDKAGNNLFVLKPHRGALKITGKVTGLAAGERIFAARMFGDKGYMVTFRQTDPLFTFDLSDPTNPKLAGELKINGFSSYIHPIDGDRLLTIGRDADDDGRVKGMHLQIFDVSNPAKPVRTHQEIIDGGRYSYSAAQWDHKAFTFDPVTGTFAMPISGYSEQGDWNRSYYSGLEVFKVSKDGFEYAGFVSHTDHAPSSNRWAAQIGRSMIIGKSIVSVSNVAIMASSLEDPNDTLSVALLEKPKPRVYRFVTGLFSGDFKR